MNVTAYCSINYRTDKLIDTVIYFSFYYGKL